MLKIHYGSNGTYKTSGAIQDDVVPQLLRKAEYDKQGNLIHEAGRIVVTNIRGFTLDRFLSVFPDTPDTSDIINLDLDVPKDLERMRTVLFWAPVGALIVFDEAQLVFPKQWRDKHLEEFTPVQEGSDWLVYGQSFKKHPAPLFSPMNWIDSWTRHRHWNFDVILTSQSLKLIRDDIKAVAEAAYSHTNLAVIGIGGRYKESMHNASLPVSQSTIVTSKKIKQETFKLYDSTATGITTDTKAGQSIFKSPQLLIALLCFVGAASYAAYSSQGGRDYGSPSDKISTASIQDSREVPEVRIVQNSVNDSAGPADKQPDKNDLAHPYEGSVLHLKAYMRGKGQTFALFKLFNDESGVLYTQTLTDAVRVGYRVDFKNQCYAEFWYNDLLATTATCSVSQNEQRRIARL
jgi:zona occludens toxin